MGIKYALIGYLEDFLTTTVTSSQLAIQVLLVPLVRVFQNLSCPVQAMVFVPSASPRQTFSQARGHTTPMTCWSRNYQVRQVPSAPEPLPKRGLEKASLSFSMVPDCHSWGYIYICDFGFSGGFWNAVAVPILAILGTHSHTSCSVLACQVVATLGFCCAVIM